MSKRTTTLRDVSSQNARARAKTMVSDKEYDRLLALVKEGCHHHSKVRELRGQIATELGLKAEPDEAADLDDLDSIEETFDFIEPRKGLNYLLKELRIGRSPRPQST